MLMHKECSSCTSHGTNTTLWNIIKHIIAREENQMSVMQSIPILSYSQANSGKNSNWKTICQHGLIFIKNKHHEIHIVQHLNNMFQENKTHRCFHVKLVQTITWQEKHIPFQNEENKISQGRSTQQNTTKGMEGKLQHQASIILFKFELFW